jgi:hypothetical protein
MAQAQSGSTVTVGLKTPHGLRLRLFKLAETVELTRSGQQTVKAAQAGRRRVRPQRQQRPRGHVPPGLHHPRRLRADAQHPEGFLRRVDEAERDSDIVKNKLIFAHSTEVSRSGRGPREGRASQRLRAPEPGQAADRVRRQDQDRREGDGVRPWPRSRSTTPCGRRCSRSLRVGEPPLAQSYWNRAGLQVDNTACSPITDDTPGGIRATILNLITAHIAALNAAINGVAPSGIVGRISGAPRGHGERVQTHDDRSSRARPSGTHRRATAFEAWTALAPYRTARYVAGPQRNMNPWYPGVPWLQLHGSASLTDEGIRGGGCPAARSSTEHGEGPGVRRGAARRLSGGLDFDA